MSIRRYEPTDRDALYEVCLRTGDSGKDATGKYFFPELLGDVFVGPYLALQPQFAFVVDVGAGAQGYVLGALDSLEFAARCEEEWWPPRRAEYAAAIVPEGYADGWVLRWIESPPPVPEFAAQYPSHLHIDLLPQVQGGGRGRGMIERLFDELRSAGSPGVHLGVGRNNANAIGFYRHLGFTELSEDADTLWLGLQWPEAGTA